MKFWVGTTDGRWFDFLSNRNFDEVNFWQPSTKPPFTTAATGIPFLFKLKRPYNHISGGGFFINHSAIPIGLAWEIFGERNGASSLEDLRDLLEPLTNERSSLNEIGCQVIANPFYLTPEQWLPNPPGWSSNIVRGKMYNSSDTDGSVIWRHFEHFFLEDIYSSIENQVTANNMIRQESQKYGMERIFRPRIGQGAFRLGLTNAYKRRCAITGENTLVTLEAAHIVPYAHKGTHEISNGLLMRADFHRLFDTGLVGVTPDLKTRISPRIQELWFNGKVYYRLDNQPLAVVPESLEHRPNPDYLDWHMRNIFQN